MAISQEFRFDFCTLIIHIWKIIWKHESMWVLERSFTQDPLLDVIGYETDASIKLIGGNYSNPVHCYTPAAE